MKGNTHTIPSAFNNHFGKSSSLKAASDVFPDCQVLVKLICVVFAFGIPLGAPVFVDCEAKTDWINFLSHDSLKVNCLVWLIQRTLRWLQFLRLLQQELPLSWQQELPLSWQQAWHQPQREI